MNNNDIRQAARDLISGPYIDEHDIEIADAAEVERVDGGAWVDARVFVAESE